MIFRTGHITIDDFERMVARGDFEKSSTRVNLIRGVLQVTPLIAPEAKLDVADVFAEH